MYDGSKYTIVNEFILTSWNDSDAFDTEKLIFHLIVESSDEDP